MNDLCNRLTDILQYEGKKISYRFEDDQLIVDLDCYALSGTAAGRINDLARKENRSFVITIRAIDCPKIQLAISL